MKDCIVKSKCFIGLVAPLVVTSVFAQHHHGSRVAQLASTTLSAAGSNTVASASHKVENVAVVKIMRLRDGTILKTMSNGAIVKIKGRRTSVILSKFPGVVRKASAQTPVSGKGTPTASLSAPNAFGGGGVSVFAVIGGANRWPTTRQVDGMGGVGFSVGDPHKIASLLVSIGTTDLGFLHNSFAENSGVSVRLNHYLSDNSAIAIGASNAVGWGIMRSKQSSQNYYVAGTHEFASRIPVVVNAGVGTGAFYSSFTSHGDDTVYPFVSMGFSIFKNCSLIADWTAHQVNLGAAYTFTFIPKLPIFLSLGAMNVNQYQNTRAIFQGMLGLSYTIRA